MEANIKAKFFALYLGQNIEYNLNSKTKIEPLWGMIGESTVFKVGENGFTTKPVEKCWLLLRTIDQLTDDECIVIHSILNPKSQIDPESNLTLKSLYISIIKSFMNGESNFNRELFDTLYVTDYLRSIGILLPFTYLDNNTPTTLSVDDILGMGWVNIEER